MGEHVPNKIRICNCIIYISNNKISLVELKRGSPDRNVWDQFKGGMEILKRVLDSNKPICLQAVLFTSGPFTDRSETLVLKKPLDNVRPEVTILKKPCGSDLPDEYVPNCVIGR